jgi:hypothetical protein
LETQTLTAPERKQLQRKIMTVLKKEMKDLRKPFQRMLADDLVTAFENRISIIQTAQQEIGRKRG